MATDTRLKGVVGLAMVAVGDTVWVWTLAEMLAFLPTVISGTLELAPRITPKALPWPTPCTWAAIEPGVLVAEFSASAITSRRGTVAKAPIYIAVAVVMPRLVTVWEPVTACAETVPVLSRPPTLVTFRVVVVGTPLTVVVTVCVTFMGVVEQVVGETWVP